MIGAVRIPENVKRAVVNAWNGYCACKNCFYKATEIHHIKPNTKANNKKWPLFMQSPFNLRPICRTSHNSGAIYEWKITDQQADMYEAFLRELRGTL